jgi:hypothetical protein
MILVRLLALTALAVWLGGMLALTVLFGDVAHRFGLIGLTCGAVIILCFFVMKFVGPPPRAFVMRVAITCAMLMLTVYSFTVRAGSPAPVTANMALGFVLLLWYVRE